MHEAVLKAGPSPRKRGGRTNTAWRVRSSRDHPRAGREQHPGGAEAPSDGVQGRPCDTARRARWAPGLARAPARAGPAPTGARDGGRHERKAGLYFRGAGCPGPAGPPPNGRRPVSGAGTGLAVVG